MTGEARDFGPPPTHSPVVVQLAFWEGEAYIAPLGSSLDVPESWKRVASLDEAADRVGVEWTNEQETVLVDTGSFFARVPKRPEGP